MNRMPGRPGLRHARDQGEHGHVDLLTVLLHEEGHSLGLGRDAAGVMQESLPAGTRHLPSAPEGVAATALPPAGGSRPDARRAAPKHPAPGGALDQLFAGAGWAGLPPWDNDFLTDLALHLAAGASIPGTELCTPDTNATHRTGATMRRWAIGHGPTWAGVGFRAGPGRSEGGPSARAAVDRCNRSCAGVNSAAGVTTDAPGGVHPGKIGFPGRGAPARTAPGGPPCSGSSARPVPSATA
jgi:hypothetical protein